MKNEIIKLGIVGLGRGLSIVKDILCDTDVKITAICDRNSEKIESAKAYFDEVNVTGYECFEDFDEFLKADTDAIIVATDAIYHVPFVVKAMDAGKHVLSEIPAVNSLEEAKILKKAVSSHPELKYMAGENDCFLGFIEAWKKMYEEGKFGEAVYAEAEYLHGPKDINFKAEDYPKEHWRTFNPAIKYVTHDLGPLLYIMNDRVVSVNCQEPDVVCNPYKEKGSENAVALFKTAKGAVIRVFICFGAYVGCTHNYALYGTKGSIMFDKCAPRREAHSYARFSDIPGKDDMIDIPITCGSFGDGKGVSHLGIDRKMMRAFINCIKNDTKPPVDVDLAIRMSLPGIYAHESALQNGAPVEIPDVDDFDI